MIIPLRLTIGVSKSPLLAFLVLITAFELRAASHDGGKSPPAQRLRPRFPARLGIPDILDGAMPSPVGQVEYTSPSKVALEGSDDLDGYLLDSPNSSEDEKIADALIYHSMGEEEQGVLTKPPTPIIELGKDVGKGSKTARDAPLVRWPDMSFSVDERIKIIERLARIYQLSERYIPTILRSRYEHQDGVNILSNDMHTVIEGAHYLKLRGKDARLAKRYKHMEMGQNSAGPSLPPAEPSSLYHHIREAYPSPANLKPIVKNVERFWHDKMTDHTRRDSKRRLLQVIAEPGIARRILENEDEAFIEALARQVGPARYKQYLWQLKLSMKEVEEVYRIVLDRMIDDEIDGQARAMGSRRLGLSLDYAKAQKVLQGDQDFLAELVREITDPFPSNRLVRKKRGPVQHNNDAVQPNDDTAQQSNDAAERIDQ